MEAQHPMWKHVLRFFTRVIIFVLGFFVLVAFPYIVVHALLSIDLLLVGFFIFQLLLYTFAIEHIAEELLVRLYGF